MASEIAETKAIEQVSDSLYKGVSDIIDNARQEVVVYVNKHSDLMFWHMCAGGQSPDILITHR